MEPAAPEHQPSPTSAELAGSQHSPEMLQCLGFEMLGIDTTEHSHWLHRK